MKRTLISVLVPALLASACSGGATTVTTDQPSQPIEHAAPTTAPVDPADTAPPGIGFPVTVDHDGGVAEIPARPARIAALSATHIEMLFAIGAGPQVIAADMFSNHPVGEVERLQVIDSLNLSVESVIDLDPDLVVLSFDPGGGVAALEAVGIPVLLLGTAADIQVVYDQILSLGTATGREVEATGLVDEMTSEIAEIVTASAADTAGISFYHESDPFSYYTPNSASFIGSLYGLLGMVNIADEAPDEFSSGFPQLSAEFIVASDPQVVYLAGFGETPETFAARDGWETMSAVGTGAIVMLDHDVASRWGPRVVDLIRSIAEGASTAGGG